ncbi:MAG: methyltransferase, partial [Nocardioidaceae bacterium]
GGRDGLAVARACLEVLEAHLADGGVAVLQLRDASQAAAVTDHLARSTGRLRAVESRVVGDGALVQLRC